MRNERATRVRDSSDDDAEGAMKLPGFLPVSRSTDGATHVAVVKHFIVRRVCAVHAVRTGHGRSTTGLNIAVVEET